MQYPLWAPAPNPSRHSQSLPQTSLRLFERVLSLEAAADHLRGLVPEDESDSFDDASDSEAEDGEQ